MIRPLFHRLNKFRTDPKVVERSPLFAVILLEAGNVHQLIRMWSEWTAAGQSVWGWLCVNIALWLWLNFYLVFNRANTFAIWGTIIGILMNASVLVSVLLLRYVV